jgi:hypothetical protein
MWVLCSLIPSSYGTQHISDWEIVVTTKWHTKTIKKDVFVRINLMNLLFLERVDLSSSVNIYKYHCL